jgi:glucose-6-phosphate isomerase
MLALHIKNLQKIDQKHGLNFAELETVKKLLPTYLTKIHAHKQGFYDIVDDLQTVEQIKKFAKINSKKYKEFVVLGIGGSALGPICLQQSLTHLFKAQKLRVIDNIDPIMIQELEETINLKETLFIVITKSGGTPETLAQYFYFQKKITEKNLNPKDHFVFVTDPEKGLLRQIARDQGITTFDVPENVGGRFSVLTPVGLLPAALLGINIDNILEGARKQKQLFLSNNPEENIAFKLASVQYLLSKKGKSINVMMPYSQKLIRFADWYRQLLAESIGKKEDNNGNLVHTGITPINALGATDQHSQSQLYNEGPNDKLIMFIEVEDFGADMEIPIAKTHSSELDFLENVTFKKLFQTEKHGTEEAYTKNSRPNITIKINAVNEEALGELFMLLEGSIAFLGEFFNINAFDQPGVELSKNLTKQLLSS